MRTRAKVAGKIGPAAVDRDQDRAAGRGPAAIAPAGDVSQRELLGLQRSIGNGAVARRMATARETHGAASVVHRRLVERRPAALPGGGVLFRHGNPEDEPLEVQAKHDPAAAVLQRHGNPEDEPLEVQAKHDPALETTVVRGGAGGRRGVQRRVLVVQRVNTGIAKGKAVGKYVAAIHKLKPKWKDLGSDARAAELGKAANARLKDAGVAQCKINVKAFGGGTNGQFDFTTWTIDINEKLVKQDEVTDDELSDVADTMYHEARHAEQWFRIARWLAGTKKKKAAEIAAEMAIPDDIAKKAVAAGLKESGKVAKKLMGKDAIAEEKKMLAEAEAWHKNIYGTGGTARNATLNALDPTGTAYETAKKAHDDKYLDAVDKNQKAEQAFLEAKDNFDVIDGEDSALVTEYQAKVAAGTAGATDIFVVMAKQIQLQLAEALKDDAFAKWEEAWNEMDALQKNLDTATLAAIAAHEKYKALVEEADAWALGDRVKKAYAKAGAKKTGK
jgi:hypothetical protein